MRIKSSHPFISSAFTAAAVVSLLACSHQSTKDLGEKNRNFIANITVSNPSDFARIQEPLYFSFYNLGLPEQQLENTSLIVQDGTRIIPSQIIDSDNNGQADTLMVSADFPLAQTREFTVVSDEHNTRSAAKSFSLANAKKHFPLSPWGGNILSLGKTLGEGGIGFWNGKEVELTPSINPADITLAEHGALYSGMNIRYTPWSINNKLIDISSNISMAAGSSLARVRIRFSPHDNDIKDATHPKIKATNSLTNIAIGMTKNASTALLSGNDKVSGYAWTYAASWGKQEVFGQKNVLGSAIIFKRGDRKEQAQTNNAYVSVMENSGGELEYYFITLRDNNSQNIKTAEEFKTYLNQETEKLTKQPRVKIDSAQSKKAHQQPMDAARALSWATRLADSELDRKTLNYAYGQWDINRKRAAKFEYDITGLQILALQELNIVNPSPRYTEAATKVTGSFITDSGSIQTFSPSLFSIDAINPGRVVINLEQQTGEKKYRKAADFLREQLHKHPRTSEGAFWHRSTYPNQLWLDGVYMGIPFLAQYAATYETGHVQHESFVEAVKEFQITRQHLRNPITGLYFHGWDESKKASWSNPTTGLSQQHWSRGAGWLAMAAVDVLDYLPTSEKELRKIMIDLVNEFAADIARYQDPVSHTWWQITDRPSELGNYHESSASSMYTYFFAKGVTKGYLPETYRQKAIDSYTGLVSEFMWVHADNRVSMSGQCLVAGLSGDRDGSYNYYMTEPITINDPKGNGPFILAGIEIYKLLKK